MPVLERAEERLRELVVIPMDASAAAEFEWLRHHKKLKKIGRPELLIACIALAHRATLVTRNLKNF
jgi:tRNA(fMet)-specific endonuclease VapC